MENGAEIRNSEELAWKSVKIFTTQDETFGLPSTIFFSGIGVSLALGVAIEWWVAIIIAMFFYIPMYYIHKEDPRGLQVWIRAMKRKHSRWSAGRSATRRLIIIE